MAAKKETKTQLAYPKNLTVTGQLSFPLWSEDDLTRLAEWRANRGLKKGKYPDRLGGTLFLNQAQVDKITEYLTGTFLPFVSEQYAATNGDKGLDKDTVLEIEKKVKANDWSMDDYLLPIRNLSAKDADNVTEDIVAKWSFGASGGNEIQKKFLGRNADGDLEVIGISAVENVPEDALDGIDDTLYWGSRNTFRGAFNLNAYEAASTGISAYTRSLYLMTDLPMTWGSGSDDEEVLEDDFED